MSRDRNFYLAMCVGYKKYIHKVTGAAKVAFPAIKKF